MKVDYLEKQLLPIGFLMQDSLSGVAALVKEVFTRTRVNGDEEDKISYWQLIFLQSKAKLSNLPLTTRETKSVRDERAAQMVSKEPFKK